MNTELGCNGLVTVPVCQGNTIDRTHLATFWGGASGLVAPTPSFC